MKAPPAVCPFCHPDKTRVILRTKQVFALWDGFPVTEGHALIVPHRHVPSWFDATHDERAELFGAIDAVRESAVPSAAAFEYESRVLRFKQPLPDAERSAFQGLVREITEWRLAEYLSRSGEASGEASFTLKVSHANSRPILFLPDRTRAPNIPEGWQSVSIDGQRYEANFVKVAINVVRSQGSEENALPSILRGWFGHDAGLPGTNHTVVCERVDDEWQMRPSARRNADEAEIFKRYSREQIPRLFGDEFSEARWNSGFVLITPESPKHVVLLVTLHKGDMASNFQYGDHFLSPHVFQWQSQIRTKQSGKHGKLIRDHAALGVQVHLFVRAEKKRAGGASAPFVYCGPVTFVDWDGEAPITVRWRLSQPPQSRIADEFAVPATAGPTGAGTLQLGSDVGR